MKKRNWGFDTKDMDTRIRPQDNFYQYAGGGWMKRNAIPKNESRWGSFMILRQSVDNQLRTLTKEIIKKRGVKKGSPEQLVRDFIHSGMDTVHRKELGLTPIAKQLALIDRIHTSDDLVPAIVKLEKLGGDGVWGAMVDQDMKNSEKYILYLGQGGLGMPDRDYYLKNDAESKRVRSAYRTHLTNLIRLATQSKNATKDMETVFAMEKKLAEISMKKEDLRDVDKTYFKYSITKLQKLIPEVDWKEYFHLLGAKCTEVVVMQPDFFKAAGKLLYSVPVEDWKVYLRTHLVNNFASSLTPALEKESFAFYGVVLSGVKQMKPLWRRILHVVNGAFGQALGQLYVKRYFSPHAKEMMLDMVENIFTAYESRIKNLDWMTPATKKKAIEKLHQVTRKIGYPDVWKKYKGIVINPDEYVGNIIRVEAWHSKQELKKLTKKRVDRKEWFMYPQTVNAYCSFGLNDVVFPAGILQPPFFSSKADAAINYGAIGSVIGHEITHAFDDQGSKFDGHGNRKTWWTTRDSSQFDKKTKLVVSQFNTYRVADDIPVNGQLTLGENIADLGGISIAYDAYQQHLSRTSREDINGFTPEQRFFLGASLFERELARPEFIKMQVTTDPHSPGEFRVNGPLSNLLEFYEAYGVKKGDALYREPKNRSKIW